MSAAPDRLGHFVGWKGLLADGEGGLWSPSFDTLWPAGEPLVAKCHNPKHKPPHRGCMCGIYAVKTYDDLKRHGYNWGDTRDGKVWVLAEIALWGEYVRGAIGYKAGRAAVQKVYVPAQKIRLGKIIKDRYGVDLGLIDRFSGRRT